MSVYSNNNYRLLHIHTPKTGGSSIKKLFENNSYITSLHEEDPAKFKLQCSPQHYHGEILNKLINSSDFDYIFSIYRDPMERLISQYKWERNHTKKQVVININDWIPRTFQKYKFNSYIEDNHIRPQSEFYIEGCEVYNFNNLHEMCDKLSSMFSLKNSELPHIHKMSMKKSDLDINQENLNLIRDFYKSDYEWFEQGNVL